MVRDQSADDLFELLQAEMIKLADSDVGVLSATLKALAFWEHGSARVATSCCHLLELDSVQGAEIVGRICRLAFCYPIPGVKVQADVFTRKMLTKLYSLIEGGDVELNNDLVSSFAAVSWSDGQKRGILQATLSRGPASDLSPPSQTAVITVIAPALWSLLEELDPEVLANFVRGLPAGLIAECTTGDTIASRAWARILLSSIFRSPLETDTRPLWNFLRSVFHNTRTLFAPDLHIEAPERGLLDGGEISKEVQNALVMKLFWSSRFFEVDCKSWSRFSNATADLMQKKLGFFEELYALCSAMEREAQKPKDYKETKAHKVMIKILDGVKAAGNTDPPTAPRATSSATHQRSSSSLRVRGGLPPSHTSSGPLSSPLDPTITPSNTLLASRPPDQQSDSQSRIRDNPPFSPTLSGSRPRFSSPLDLMITPSDTPPASRSTSTDQQSGIQPQIRDNLPSSTSSGSRPHFSPPPDLMTTPSNTPPVNRPADQQSDSQPQIRDNLPSSPTPSGSRLRFSSLLDLTTTPSNTPPASRTTYQQNSDLPQTRDNLPSSPTSSGSRPRFSSLLDFTTTPSNTPPANRPTDQQSGSQPQTRDNLLSFPTSSGSRPRFFSLLDITATLSSTPPASRSTDQQSGRQPQTQDNHFPSPTTSPEPPPFPPRHPPVLSSSREQSTPTNDNGDRRLPTIQSGSGVDEPINAGPQSRYPVLPD